MRARENAKPTLLRKALACLLSAAMCVAFTPAVAWGGTEPTVTEVSNGTDLKSAIESGTAGIVKLGADIDIAETLSVGSNLTVTLDLNDHVLKMTGNYGVIKVEDGGNLTLTDSAPTKTAKTFSVTDKLWTLAAGGAEGGTKSVSGGIITGGNASEYGGGVYVAGNGTFAMSGGKIVGCSASGGGGVYVAGGGRFDMTGGSIEGCTAPQGGGVYVKGDSGSVGTFAMSGGEIEGCAATATNYVFIWGGGICNYGKTELSGNAATRDCQAFGSGGSCYGGGICSVRKLTIEGDVTITGCVADETSGAVWAEYAEVSGGTFGETTNDSSDSLYLENSTISGGTFNGQVTNGWFASNTISGGTFNGQVTNFNGTVTDGTFYSKVSNQDKISGGTFHGEVTNGPRAESYGTAPLINGGTFYGRVVNNKGSEYTGGSKAGWPAGTISGGTFYGGLDNKATQSEILGCTVTYETEQGKTYAIQIVTNGGTATQPDKPAKEGYAFAGWYKDNESVYDFNTSVTGNPTLTAQWAINQYTITFDTDGGTTVDSITQDYGTAVTAPEAPTKTGYTFDGWDVEIPATMPAKDTTIKAKWTVNQYTITFDTDGGTAIDPITQDYGTDITAPENPTKSGYRFVGWDTEIPATMPAENITIKAKWQYVPPATPQASADCIKAIDALSDAEAVTLESGEAIKAARSAYDALTSYQKSFVAASKVAKLEAVEARYSDLVAAAPVEAAIDALPDVDGVTLESGEAIQAARDAYDALSDYHKGLVPSDALAKLEAVEAHYSDVVVVAPAVEALEALPKAGKLKVKDAKAAAKAAKRALKAVAGLTEAQQALVDEALAANAEAVVAQAAELVTKADAKAAGKVKSKKLAVKSGKSKSIRFTTKASAAGTKVTYKKSSGSKYITVTKSGKITAKKAMKKGKTYTAKVKVTCGDATAYVKVVVNAK